MSKKFKSNSVVRRYTDLPALLYMLTHRRITLLDPSQWDDKNDSHYLLEYKKKKKIQVLLALCLTRAAETYHHWRIFAHGNAGVCVEFREEELLGALRMVEGVTVRDVTYRKVRRADGTSFSPPKVVDLPFLKRSAFEDECELRAVYESTTAPAKDKDVLDIAIPIESVLQISLSPWMNKRLAAPIKAAIRSIHGCEGMKVRQSTLIGNAEWKRMAERAS